MHERTEMLSFLPKEYSTVLEIGCGKGAFASALTLSSEKWGVEMSASAATEAENVFNTVLVGTYREIERELPDQYFDLIICNDVIEHMPDAEQFLIDIQKKMVEGGQLVGSIPNVRYYDNFFKLIFGRDWKYTDEGVLDRTHQRFFTEKS
jgi:2-polyprenyl-3-methyl-5-hydroxy-6-metoxy-1,4-benzoquinol methylase